MTLLTSALLIVGGIFGSAVVMVFWMIGKAALTQEASNVLPDATRGVVDRATRRLPVETRKRFEEEWRGALEEEIEKRPIRAFREAVSIYRGAGKLARELEPAPARTGRIGPRLRAGGQSASQGFARVADALTRSAAWINRLVESIGKFDEAVVRLLESVEASLRVVLGVDLDRRLLVGLMVGSSVALGVASTLWTLLSG